MLILNWSNDQQISFELSIYSIYNPEKNASLFPQKYLVAQLFSTLIIRYVSWALNHYIKMIAEGSCDTQNCRKFNFPSQEQITFQTILKQKAILNYDIIIHSKIAIELHSKWSFIFIIWIRAAVTFRSTGKSHTSDRETWVRLDNDRMSGVQESFLLLSLFICQEKSSTVFHICPHDTSYTIHFHFSEKSIFRLPQHPRMQWEIESLFDFYHI